jgi:antitoxin (DNA-binding transcriptional repressor) of toxin-antitoxin stability system
MKITIQELRRSPRKLMDAIDRNEEVIISRGGCDVARVVPMGNESRHTSIHKHPAFGMWADRHDMSNPSTYIRNQRRNRFVGRDEGGISGGE